MDFQRIYPRALYGAAERMMKVRRYKLRGIKTKDISHARRNQLRGHGGHWCRFRLWQGQ